MHKLSVLICTLPKRRDLFERLVEHIKYYSDEKEVEVLANASEGITVGAKRQLLLSQAGGEFVSFVDDDDWVPFYYTNAILGAIDSNCDVVGINGVITTNCKDPKVFMHSMVNGRKWFETNDAYFRPPNHLNPVRREIALKTGYKDMGFQEDKDYSQRLFDNLYGLKESYIKPCMYFYKFSTAKKEYL